jgi:hypothetical protein
VGPTSYPIIAEAAAETTVFTLQQLRACTRETNVELEIEDLECHRIVISTGSAGVPLEPDGPDAECSGNPAPSTSPKLPLTSRFFLSSLLTKFSIIVAERDQGWSTMHISFL